MSNLGDNNTGKCNFCDRVDNLHFRCNYCKERFCSDHRNPLIHSCPFLELYNRNSHNAKFAQNYHSGSSGSWFNIFQRIFWLKSSRTELLHLSIATVLVTCVGLSLNQYRTFSWQFLAIFISAFLVHELAHKFLAQYYGSWAEFRAQTYGLIITAISALPIMPFKFIAPGAVMVHLGDRQKFGRVALIGPVTNLIMGFAFLLLSNLYGGSNGHYFAIGASFNGWIAMFNLIPMGVLDGQKIFDWNKIVWGISMTAAMLLFIIGYI
ncbi:AN1-type zinc finger domain-containing protein [Candidatus Nitrosocosmicus franklandus]|uniref:Peptidase family M50 n=1 Tax=Candidatus Nitrosocosmicus franklandianus TaxID=1798806 RepID=A0A484IJC2_9ARCH|nr:AN1-type zinc finger domain-containing protein [Candidatus Nitrosocosmicus franklandus]VFJ14988.1 Peptidase family M50 [Candidatus Nitrosocosmicus franklandus]